MAVRIPANVRVPGALFASSLLGSVGALVLQLGVVGGNPLVFTLVSGGVSATVLLALHCYLLRSQRPSLKHLPAVVAVGLALSSEQVCFILGTKLDDAVSGATWHLMTPLIATALSCLLGFERATRWKVLGLLLAVSGAVFMVLDSAGFQVAGGQRVLAGHALFFGSTLAGASNVLLSKTLLREFPPLSVMTWKCVVAACFTLMTTAVVGRTPSLLARICVGSVDQACEDQPWTVPTSMILPLAYLTFVVSLFAAFLGTWATKRAPPSTATIFTVAHPVTTALLSALLVLVMGESWAQQNNMRGLGLENLAIVPIVLGLFLVLKGSQAESAGPTGSKDGTATEEEVGAEGLRERAREEDVEQSEVLVVLREQVEPDQAMAANERLPEACEAVAAV